MLLLETKKLEKWFGVRKLFSDINFNIYSGDRIALIGRNGTGKTTMINIILGKDRDFSGEVNSKTNIGYLPQYYSYTAEQTVEEFMTEETYNYGEFLKLMKKFDFEVDFLDRKIANCSGGEQTKLQLIRLLSSQKVELLILDEPTNHLDLETRDWLASFINDFNGAVLTVSHDRHFLDRTITKVWELEQNKLQTYNGNYSDYKEQKEIMLQRQYKEYEEYQAEKNRLKNRKRKQQQFVQKTDGKGKRTDSFWHVTKGSDRRKGRFAKRVKSLESQIEKLDQKDKPFENRKINPDFERKEIASQIIVEAKAIRKIFADLCLFKNMNFKIEKDSKIALMGPNGSGKSVLLKIILEKINIDSGKLLKSSQLKIGYFSQKIENLNLDNSILEELRLKNPDKDQEIIRTFLGSMLFEGRDVFKKIKDLSIGERVRAAFAVLLLGKFNLLLLDEPLNHLDIESREIIEKALKNYNGAFVVVSHNRYFIEEIAQEIWQLKEGNLEVFPGSYNQYQKLKKGEYKSGEDLDQEIVKMKKAELYAKLEEAAESEKEEIINDLEALTDK
ncbi:ATP-binding cassette subfamily F protein 3/macrolide transport system ATP-binding/permease protein [Halanaerobium saccharolyticum]|uniref:ATP-binding cassette subfamily F protein 3/macrolide transport system ATP-binding/permease protein n=1 Tax=Halanaerobium saccharolyticum TaxID=43595 RepID=A0A4R6LCU7_9FIRM|nr:ABC-F type ribosomal protection protein [Halanaerobium saccharolyticum]TDO77236.1 ATP-binding cassette subfamily F protein 3/macrolide transport system ATP-binding/permease protein [Halanaerobium saccharolyticum]